MTTTRSTGNIIFYFVLLLPLCIGAFYLCDKLDLFKDKKDFLREAYREARSGVVTDRFKYIIQKLDPADHCALLNSAFYSKAFDTSVHLLSGLDGSKNTCFIKFESFYNLSILDAEEEDVIARLANEKEIIFNYPNDDRETIFHEIVRYNSLNGPAPEEVIIDQLKFASKLSIDINQSNIHFVTPLMMAFSYVPESYSGVIHTLMDLGADIHQTTGGGETVLSMAINRKRSGHFMFLPFYRILLDNNVETMLNGQKVTLKDFYPNHGIEKFYDFSIEYEDTIQFWSAYIKENNISLNCKPKMFSALSKFEKPDLFSEYYERRKLSYNPKRDIYYFPRNKNIYVYGNCKKGKYYHYRVKDSKTTFLPVYGYDLSWDDDGLLRDSEGRVHSIWLPKDPTVWQQGEKSGAVVWYVSDKPFSQEKINYKKVYMEQKILMID